MHRIYGIDFSGAKDAGRRIWITDGIIKKGILEIQSCNQASDFLGDKRDQSLAGLRDFIAREKNCIFGLDFPFGLPGELVEEDCWEDFVLDFPQHYPGLQEFREKCQKASHNSELKRVTDIESKAPFSPYNLRIYRQTYYGIRDILCPLVRDNLACVLPMQKIKSGKPCIIEICPASSLKRLLGRRKLPSYKGASPTHRAERARILEALETTGVLTLSSYVRSLTITDNDGDALDSVIAAYAVFQALRNPAITSGSAYRAYLLEGYVFC